MSKYLVLYRSPVTAAQMMSSMTSEQSQEGMALWMQWYGSAGNAIVDMGSPLGEGRTVGPGSVTPTDGKVTGYSILEAESLDAAVKLVEDHPHFKTPGESSVEVIEMLHMPGM